MLQLRLGLNSWPRNFHLPWVWPLKQNKTNKQKRLHPRSKCTHLKYHPAEIHQTSEHWYAVYGEKKWVQWKYLYSKMRYASLSINRVVQEKQHFFFFFPWGATLPQMFNFLEDKSNVKWVFLILTRLVPSNHHLN